jgi:A/G-specific adenine glycosylase
VKSKSTDYAPLTSDFSAEVSFEADDAGKTTFARPLVQWFNKNKRDMPWRETAEPYRVWLSEVMLQQTRVDQATPYFLRFIERFPDVFSLAEADIQEVLILWEGLGYYSRARNMHQAAKTVASLYGGKFPTTWSEMRSLRGIGDYTAAAVLSICHNQPYPVVDGNVVRVISRYCGITQDIRKSAVLSMIRTIAGNWLPGDAAGDFNQAMMELGATICTPKKPKCGECPVQTHCVANRLMQTDVIPYKSASAKVPHYTIVAGIIYNRDGTFLIQRRPDNAMLGGLWEFPGGKLQSGETLEQALQREIQEELGVKVADISAFHSLKHAYSHFKITLHAFTCTLSEGIPQPKASPELRWITPSEIRDFPFPKANRILTEKLARQDA